MLASRLLAASAALTVSLGLGLGGTAAAQGVGPTADPTASTAPTTAAPTTAAPTTAAPTTAAPTTAAPTTAAPDATTAPTTPPATTPASATPTPTQGATATPTSVPQQPCTKDDRFELKTTWTGLQGVKLLQGGPAVSSTFTVQNTSGRALPALFPALILNSSQSLAWGSDLLMEMKLPGGSWAPVPLENPTRPTLLARPTPFPLAKGETLTIDLRLSAPGPRAVGNVLLVWLSTLNLPAAEAGPGNCTFYTADARTDLTVVNPAVPSPTASVPADGASPEPTTDRGIPSSMASAVARPTTGGASPTAGAGGASPSATPSASPSAAGAGTGAQGTQLAHTGADATTPMAVGGAAAVAAGVATVVFVQRRRKRANS